MSPHKFLPYIIPQIAAAVYISFANSRKISVLSVRENTESVKMFKIYL